MSSNYVSRWQKDIFSYQKTKNPLCDSCKKNMALPDFYVQTLSYYRNKSSSHYFLCSKECETNCNAKMKCRGCGYGEDLVFIENKNYSLCTNYPYAKSCYEKKIKYNQYIDGTALCSFLCHAKENPKQYIEKQIDEDIILNVCLDCNQIYEKIVLWKKQKTNLTTDENCIFCHKNVDEPIFITRYEMADIVFCENCYSCYKQLVL